MKYLTMKDEILLLSILRLKSDAYLVNIREYLIKSTVKKWSVGNVFVSLSKLENQHYILPRIGDPSAKRGGKAIKYYDITDLGFEALINTKKMQDEMWNGLHNIVFEKNK